MNEKIRLKIYRDSKIDLGDPISEHYHLGLEFKHERFSVHFMTPAKFTREEANYRIIKMAAALEADIDGIILAN